MNAFSSIIHSQVMLELHSRSVSLDVIFPLYYMYRHLKVHLKLGNVLSDNELPVFVGKKQGAITSPIIHNNTSLPAQIGLPISCISKGTDTSMLCYADDLLNPCRSIASLQPSFDNLSDRYLEIELSMNAAKFQVLFLNLQGSYVPDSVCLGE